MTKPLQQKWRTKEPLDESERGMWKVDLKFNIQKFKTMAAGPITSWQMEGEAKKIMADGDCTHEIKSYFLLGRKAMANPDNILKSRDIKNK